MSAVAGLGLVLIMCGNAMSRWRHRGRQHELVLISPPILIEGAGDPLDEAPLRQVPRRRRSASYSPGTTAPRRGAADGNRPDANRVIDLGPNGRRAAHSQRLVPWQRRERPVSPNGHGTD
jgi:hypothetical protein